MELKDLDPNARLACVALFERMVLADGAGSEAEAHTAAILADTFGEDNYQSLVDAADEIHGEDALRRAVAAVGNQEARDLIFGTIIESALDGGIEHPESELIDWLKQTWSIKEEPVDDEQD